MTLIIETPDFNSKEEETEFLQKIKDKVENTKTEVQTLEEKIDSEILESARKEKPKLNGMELPSKVLFHLEPSRFDDETFEQYKERRAENNAYIKKYLSQGNSYKRAF